jgi:hypothetical protein
LLSAHVDGKGRAKKQTACNVWYNNGLQEFDFGFESAAYR